MVGESKIARKSSMPEATATNARCIPMPTACCPVPTLQSSSISIPLIWQVFPG